MTRWLRLALAVQLLFFAGWGAMLLTSHRDVDVVWLATEPVDPRDLLSGNYVALRYAMSSASEIGCTASDAPTPVWVRLAPSGDVVPTVEESADLSKAGECRTTPPEPSDGAADGTWIAGTLDGDRITYGIERMFVGEDDPLRDARSGTVVAKVAVNDEWEPRLLGLVRIMPEPSPTTPP